MRENYGEESLKLYTPYPFYKNDNEDNQKVFGQIYIDEVTFWDRKSGQVKISASLVNSRMLAIESEYIEEKVTAPLFFYEFTGTMTFDCRAEFAKRELLCGGPDRSFYQMRIIEFEESDERSTLADDTYREKIVFVGDITFSASPILSHKVMIVVEDPVCGIDEDKLKIYDKWDDTIKKECILEKKKIVSELQNFFDMGVVSKEVDIYNVGQANCCYCNLGSKALFFDIGITRSKDERDTTLVKKAIEEISELDVDAVILSHWDLDHILGVCYNKKCMENKLWVVPDFENLYHVPRLSIKRLCNYLLRNGKSKLLMVDTTDIDKVLFRSSNDSVSIYMGEPKAAYGINKMNNGGLILALQNRRNILLPGDCENSIIPSDAINVDYNNVLIPHHGSMMSMPTIKAKKDKRSVAYLSCGKVAGNCKIDSLIGLKYLSRGFRRMCSTMNLKKKYMYRVKL